MSIRCFVTFSVFLTCTCEFLEFIVVEKKRAKEEKRRKDLRKANQDDVNPGCDNSFRRRGRFEASHREHVVTSPSEFFYDKSELVQKLVNLKSLSDHNKFHLKEGYVSIAQTSEVFTFKIFLFC